MIKHKAVDIPNKYGGFITTTLCGRSNIQEKNGFNSEEIDSLVDCKLCLAIMNNPKHWRYRKYLQNSLSNK